jgi:uncharacterized protein with ParB-like and HNH nuclease domain
MIRSANQYPISAILATDNEIIYRIPKYQREYTWNKNQWNSLFDDILENEKGYFLGSIICVNKSDDTLATQSLEVIDGQQRLTTILLLFCAIYSKLNERKEILNEDQKNDLFNLKKRVVFKTKSRFFPQEQNKNSEDYFSLLDEIKILEGAKKSKYAKNRRIHQAFCFFTECINKLIAGLSANDGIQKITDYLENLTSACVVKIEVETYTDAFILFESLNNRGIPLSAIDLIKNNLLASLEKNEPEIVDSKYNKWNELIENLSDDYATQERFFRYYYNAFKNSLPEVSKASVATRSNLINIYEVLIKKNPVEFLDSISEAGNEYAILICNDKEYEIEDIKRELLNLQHIQGVPSYVLLLFVFRRRKELGLSDFDIITIIKNLICFFVRRNLTDIPPTRDLVRLFMKIIEDIKDQKGAIIVEIITRSLKDTSADDGNFKQRLSGPIYEENKDATRFILCSLAESNMNKEQYRDLWEYKGKQYIWTIEHIFPEGKNIPKSWVDMIGNGDINLAEEIQQDYVHTLGNLSISGYNASLGNKGFIEKRDRMEAGKYIGYKNGLSLNDDLANKEEWTRELIIKRTEKLIVQIFELFKFID